MVIHGRFPPAALAVVMCVMGLARGGEEGPGAAPAPPPAGPEDAAPRAKNPDKVRLKEVQRKLKAGEELTADERALLDRAKEGSSRAGARIEGFELVNALDAVKLQLAQLRLSHGDFDGAVAVLERLAKETEEQAAAGYAHLALARIYGQRGDKARGDQELAKVRGPAMAAAVDMLAGADGVARLEEMLKSADEPLSKAIIIRRLAAIYGQGGNAEKLADLAERAAKLLPYKQALEAEDAEARYRQNAPVRPGAVMPKVRPNAPEVPAQEREPRREAEPKRGDNAEALKKEIEELEGAGMFDEAEALRKQLKALNERRAKKGAAPREGGKAMPNADGDVF